MKISVVLASYNGAKYITEQIISILNQTLLPAELIITDDCSSDNTIEIVRNLQHAQAHIIHIVEGGENVGLVNNFKRGILVATGDYIALADQDDVWMLNKLELQLNALIKSKKSLIFANLCVVDENLKPLGYSMFDYLGFDFHHQKRFVEDPFKYLVTNKNIVTGSTIVMTKKFAFENIKYLNSYKEIGEIHDGIFSIRAAYLNELTFLSNELVMYRQHDNQVVSAKLNHDKKVVSKFSVLKSMLNSEFLNKLYDEQKMLHSKLLYLNVNHQIVNNLDDYLKFLASRKNLSKNPFKRFNAILGLIKEKKYKIHTSFPIINAITDFIR